jgi:hypothetical protein
MASQVAAFAMPTGSTGIRAVGIVVILEVRADRRVGIQIDQFALALGKCGWGKGRPFHVV